MIFPVKVPYTVSADIVKYAGQVLNPKPDPVYLEAKRIELERWGSDLCVADSTAVPAIKALAGYGGFADPFHGEQTEPVDALRNLALHIEEDVALMTDGKVSAICFCFPSGFVPAHILGLNFFDIHRPVADGDMLRRSGEKVSSLIAREGALYRRYVWTISTLSSLSQHTGYERPRPEKMEGLYFRTETQTTVGIGEGISLFFVKVNMHPLSEVWGDSAMREILMNSLNSMSDAVLRYKHLEDIRSLLERLYR